MKYLIFTTTLLIAGTCAAQWTGLDPSFSNDGYDHINFPGESYGKAGVVTPDDKIIVAAEFVLPGNDKRIGVARFLPDGGLDPSFSGDGIDSVDTPINASAIDVALQTDGKDLVLASQFQSNNNVVRFLPDGGLDPTFGTDGMVSIPAGNGDVPRALAVQADGKILVTGSEDIYSSSTNAFTLRLNTDGSLDNTFGTAGWVHQDIGSFQKEYSYDIIAQANGNIVIIGTVQDAIVASDYLHFLIRYAPDGTLDNTFGNGGMVVDSIGTGRRLSPGEIISTPNGYLVSGAIFYDDSTWVAVARFLADGSLDNSFSTDGWQTLRVPGIRYNGAAGMALRSDGSILIGGSSENELHADYSVVVGHLDPNGEIDQDYGGPSGLQTFTGADFGSTLLLGLYDVMVQSNDRLVGVQYINYGAPFARQLGICRFKQLITGVDELQVSMAPAVFPNPVEDHLTITFEQGGEHQFTMLDATGKTLRTVSHYGTSTQLDMRGMPSGLYFLRGNGEAWSSKLVKQ